MAQEFDFPETASHDDTLFAQAMPELAKKVLADYREAERETYLDNLFRLQMVAGQYGEAVKSISERRALRTGKVPGGGDWIDVQYEVPARAKADANRPFEEAYKEAFQNVIGQLDDRNAALVIRSMRAARQEPMKSALTRETAPPWKSRREVASRLICKPLAPRKMTMVMMAAALVSAKRMRA